MFASSTLYIKHASQIRRATPHIYVHVSQKSTNSNVQISVLNRFLKGGRDAYRVHPLRGIDGLESPGKDVALNA